MIRFTVLWSARAEAELAALWTQVPQRRNVTQAVDILDAELQTNAHQRGVLHTQNLRAISRASVTLYFHIDENDRKVFVDVVRLTESN